MFKHLNLFIFWLQFIPFLSVLKTARTKIIQDPSSCKRWNCNEYFIGVNRRKNCMIFTKERKLTLILLMWRLGWAPNSIPIYISNKMQRYTVHLYLEIALHVSGGTSTHHQERIQLYLQHLVFVTPLLLSDKYKTHKYSVGRAYSCWMLNLLVHHVTSRL
jgi:hypothetical protein